MFCPNCGKDCGTARFCISCGAKIQPMSEKNEKTTRWSVGMPCPCCGSMQLNGNRCAFCDAQLIADSQQQLMEDGLYDIPYGWYGLSYSGLTLHKEELVLQRRLLFKKQVTKIPYNQVTAVVYVRPENKFASVGYLVFRYEGNKTLPIPAEGNYGADMTTLVIANDDAVLFYHIYCLLKTLTPHGAEFDLRMPDSITLLQDCSEADSGINLFFERYAPHRTPAIKAMCEEMGIPYKEAYELINRAFDKQQEQMYATDPSAAVRDLNLVLRERKRQEELKAQQMKEQQEREMLEKLNRLEGK